MVLRDRQRRSKRQNLVLMAEHAVKDEVLVHLVTLASSRADFSTTREPDISSPMLIRRSSQGDRFGFGVNTNQMSHIGDTVIRGEPGPKGFHACQVCPWLYT